MDDARLQAVTSTPTGHDDLLGRAFNGLVKVPLVLLDLAVTWQARQEERQHLLTLTDSQLRDVGLDQRAAHDVARGSPFIWRG